MKFTVIILISWKTFTKNKQFIIKIILNVLEIKPDRKKIRNKSFLVLFCQLNLIEMFKFVIVVQKKILRFLIVIVSVVVVGGGIVVDHVIGRVDFVAVQADVMVFLFVRPEESRLSRGRHRAETYAKEGQASKSVLELFRQEIVQDRIY